MKNNKLLTIMLIILLTITLVGVIAVVLVMQLNKGPETQEEQSIDEIVVSKIEVPEITTNLADGSFVRLQLTVQTTSEESAEELLKREFQVKNIVIQELSEMEKAALEGKQGKVSFQNTIKSQVNELMQEGEVKQVYITSYIIP